MTDFRMPKKMSTIASVSSSAGARVSGLREGLLRRRPRGMPRITTSREITETSRSRKNKMTSKAKTWAK